MVAAQWLADGYDSPRLQELAALTSRQALEGQGRLADVLAVLGHPLCSIESPYEQNALARPMGTDLVGHRRAWIAPITRRWFLRSWAITKTYGDRAAARH